MFEALLAAVHADPSDDEARRVLGDWLQAHGDPRGELIALQLLATPSAAQQARISELLEHHARAWLGELAPVTIDHQFERGFVDRLGIELDPSADVDSIVGSLVWRTVRTLECERGAPHQLASVLRAAPHLRRVKVELRAGTRLLRWAMLRQQVERLELELLTQPRVGLHFEGDQLQLVMFGPIDACERELVEALRSLPPARVRVRVSARGDGHLAISELAARERRRRSIDALRQALAQQLQIEQFECDASVIDASFAADTQPAPTWQGASECQCFEPSARDFADETFIGTDETNGRFGEVSHLRCRSCGQSWLKYFVEYESFSRSGRWYRAPIDDATLATVTPANAAATLDQLGLHMFGGSYFDGHSGWSRGRVRVDL